jgi:protein-S-isoprenylcysteine O-methyltransferase Ste14
MARKSFKEKWIKLIPEPIERSTYVLLSSLALLLIFWQWQPMGGVIWDVSGTVLGTVLIGISLIGWLFVLISSFLLDHFELFGLKQVFVNLTGKTIQSSDFRTPVFYKLVRHPIYLGFTVAFWATPIMTVAHLVFAVGMLVYTLVGIFLEEKDLITLFGDEYKCYKNKVPMLIPLASKKDN